METLLSGLRAAAEGTRLRILALCAVEELTVSELVQILGQSQPRVSRHLKLLTDAHLLDRHREGNWTFYRLAGAHSAHELSRRIVELIPSDAPVVTRDRERLEMIRFQRARIATSYFEHNARQWDAIRSLHIDEHEVEQRLIELVPPGTFEALVDIGTGTGRILELLGPRVSWALGIDRSREMLAVARERLSAASLSHCRLRQGDMYGLDLPDDVADLVVVHQVLHYADRPERAIAESARLLKPGGRLIVVDFASHDLEYLREAHAHRRLGFGEEEVGGWLEGAGLVPTVMEGLPGSSLTVVLWVGDAPMADGSFRDLTAMQRQTVTASPWI